MNFDILGQYPFTAKIYTNEALSSTNYSSTYSTYFSSYKASIEYYMYSGRNYYLEIRLLIVILMIGELRNQLFLELLRNGLHLLRD